MFRVFTFGVLLFFGFLVLLLFGVRFCFLGFWCCFWSVCVLMQ
jgi:hypothetical protein